jgi:hypothetical protein
MALCIVSKGVKTDCPLLLSLPDGETHQIFDPEAVVPMGSKVAVTDLFEPSANTHVLLLAADAQAPPQLTP